VGSFASTKYFKQTVVVRDGAGDSSNFDIFSGVRQWCVLHSGNNMLHLLDLRFADRVFISTNTKEKVQNLLDNLVRHLAAAKLMLNTSQTVALTTGAQPLIQLDDNHMITVLGRAKS